VRAVVVLALVGLIALIIAVLTGSTPLAVVVIALAVAGIVQLMRDWRHDRGRGPAAAAMSAAAPQAPAPTEIARLTADDLSPDISTDPDGPSSDARADQF
jgi:hypothetical protein